MIKMSYFMSYKIWCNFTFLRISLMIVTSVPLRVSIPCPMSHIVRHCPTFWLALASKCQTTAGHSLLKKTCEESKEGYQNPHVVRVNPAVHTSQCRLMQGLLLLTAYEGTTTKAQLLACTSSEAICDSWGWRKICLFFSFTRRYKVTHETGVAQK